jgi:hypothetical protein
MQIKKGYVFSHSSTNQITEGPIFVEEDKGIEQNGKEEKEKIG